MQKFMTKNSMTTAEVALIKQLAAKGFTASQIALQVGNGRSRNSIAGFCFRHEVPLISKKISSNEAQENQRLIRTDLIERIKTKLPDPSDLEDKKPEVDKKPRAWKEWNVKNITPPDLNIIKDKPIPKHTVSLRDIEINACRFIPGDPKSLICCGQPTKSNRPYCPAHEKLCYGHSRGAITGMDSFL